MPASVKPVAVQAALRIAANETEDVRIVVTTRDRLVEEDDRELTLHVGVLGAEPEAILVGRTFEILLRRYRDRSFGTDVTSEVEDYELALTQLRLPHRKSLRSDEEVVLQVVVAGSDEALERLVTGGGDRELEMILHLASSEDQIRTLSDHIRMLLEDESNVGIGAAFLPETFAQGDAEIKPSGLCLTTTHGYETPY